MRHRVTPLGSGRHGRTRVGVSAEPRDGRAGWQEAMDPAYVGGGLCGASEGFGGFGLKTIVGFGSFGLKTTGGRFSGLGLKTWKMLSRGTWRLRGACVGSKQAERRRGGRQPEENPKLGRNAHARRLAYH